MRPTVIEVNCLTNETIEREMTDAELEQYLKDEETVAAEIE